jgi:hypothetical protein
MTSIRPVSRPMYEGLRDTILSCYDSLSVDP